MKTNVADTSLIAYSKKEKLLSTKRAYYKKNKEKILAANAAWNKANKEKIAVVKKRYYKKNKEKIAVDHKGYQEKNKEKINLRRKRPNAEYQRKKYYENIEKSRAISRAKNLSRSVHLSDVYVKSLICKAIGITHKNIPYELIEAKRSEMKITRLIKEKRNEQKSCRHTS